jgi:hypothetical protein
VHVDLIFGRTNDLIHSSSDKSTDNYIDQAYISATPPKMHGTEIDFGQFVTSAGAEVIPAMGNWNYSRSLLSSGQFLIITSACVPPSRSPRPGRRGCKSSTAGITLSTTTEG